MALSKKQKPIDLTYDEPSLSKDAGVPTGSIRLDSIFGNIPQVSSVPSWTPRRFQDGFAYYKSGATIRFYFYDFTNNAWHYVTATA